MSSFRKTDNSTRNNQAILGTYITKHFRGVTVREEYPASALTIPLGKQMQSEGGLSPFWQDARQAQGGVTPRPGGRCAPLGGTAVGEDGGRLAGDQGAWPQPGHQEAESATGQDGHPRLPQGLRTPHWTESHVFILGWDLLESRKIIKIAPFSGPVSQ